MSKRDDIAELVQDIEVLQGKVRREEFDTANQAVDYLANALDTARNCIENLADQLEALESRLDDLEARVGMST